MKKMSTLFVVNHEGSSKSIALNEIREENLWVFDEGVRVTRKYDGTATFICDGTLYKRYDAKHGKTPPEGAIPCQEPDSITGHWPHWIKCDHKKPEDKWFFSTNIPEEDGTYEFCGEKVKNNPEGIEGHKYIKHGEEEYALDISYEGIKSFLSIMSIEGLVFHHPDGRMCKIRKSDFNMKR